MTLGFKRRFAPMVEDGTKTHTIRAKRKGKHWRAGMICDCFVDPRRKTMRLLGRWMCTKVEDILIYERGDGSFGVIVGGQELDNAEKNTFAWRDGFRSNGVEGAFEEMIAYWKEEHGSRTKPLDFEGDLIHWAYAARPLLTQHGLLQYLDCTKPDVIADLSTLADVAKRHADERGEPYTPQLEDLIAWIAKRKTEARA